MTLLDADAILNAGTAIASSEAIDHGAPRIFVVPAGYDVREVDPEKYLPVPRRQTGTLHVHRPESFEQVTVDFRSPTSRIYAELDKPSLTAVHNDSAGGADTAWRDHRTVLALTPTPEWRHWTSIDNRLVDQQQFAEHVEDGIEQVITPPGAELLEVAQHMRAHTDVQFRSSKLLANGQVQLGYVEETTAQAGAAGQLEVPDTFTLALAPFEGVNPYRVTARFRYRLTAGKLTVGYKLVRPDLVLRDAFDDVVNAVAEHTQVPVLFGRP